MTTKEFLSLYEMTDQRIEELNERIIRLRSQAEKITPPYTENTGGQNPNMNTDKIPALVEMIMQEEKRTQDYIAEIAQTRKDIEAAIYAVKDAKLSTLLMMRYMQHRSWEQIAVIMHYSYVHIVHRMHPEALKAVKIPGKYEKM